MGPGTITCAGEKSTVAGKTTVPSASIVTFCTAAVPLALASFWATEVPHADAWFESDASVVTYHTVRLPDRPRCNGSVTV